MTSVHSNTFVFMCMNLYDFARGTGLLRQRHDCSTGTETGSLTLLSTKNLNNPSTVKPAFNRACDEGTPAVLEHFCSARIGFRLWTSCDQGTPAILVFDCKRPVIRGHLLSWFSTVNALWSGDTCYLGFRLWTPCDQGTPAILVFHCKRPVIRGQRGQGTGN